MKEVARLALLLGGLVIFLVGIGFLRADQPGTGSIAVAVGALVLGTGAAFHRKYAPPKT